MRVIVFGLLLAGCHEQVPDAPDATPGDSGLTVTWVARPSLPGSFDDNKLSVTAAEFHLGRFQVIGDAGPGDPRTTRSGYSLLWDATHVAEPTTFTAAPPGLYSLINFDLEAGQGYDITGFVKIDTSTKPFHVSDDAQLRVSFPCDVSKETTETTVAIRVALDGPLDGVDFESVPEVAGILELGATDPQIAQFRSDLIKAFDLDRHDSKN